MNRGKATVLHGLLNLAKHFFSCSECGGNSFGLKHEAATTGSQRIQNRVTDIATVTARNILSTLKVST
jgi:hypothetical protein